MLQLSEVTFSYICYLKILGGIFFGTPIDTTDMINLCISLQILLCITMSHCLCKSVHNSLINSVYTFMSFSI